MNLKNFEKTIALHGKEYTFYSLEELENQGMGKISRLPFSIRILLENLLRNLGNGIVKEEDILDLLSWKPSSTKEIPYYPARVLMQDFTGVPAIVDLAAMRSAMQSLGKDPRKINPLVPVDLVIDHSVQIDFYGKKDALVKNVDMEYRRNQERYILLKWAQKAFDNLRIFPTNAGICHQVNLEYIARVVMTREEGGKTFAYPDTLVGTDSHTTMINGLGVMGWGVGGIEAEAVMLGQPYYMTVPQVVGLKLYGELKEGITATDLVLSVTQLLRKHNVVDKFVEYFGPGVKKLTLPDRATLGNMSPEYGATMGFFPVDEETIQYLQFSNRKECAELVEKYTKLQNMFFYGDENPEYTEVLELDMSKIEPCVAGPKRPQDKVLVTDLKKRFEKHLEEEKVSKRSFNIPLDGKSVTLSDGSTVIAAITSCTNTSNPSLMVGAALLAKNAVEKGLTCAPYVKTSFAPGSKVVQGYLIKSGLLPYLEELGFHIAAFGCTTCIGNSGPLHPEIEKIIQKEKLVVSSVLSGNRNFEARIHPLVKGNYLASPMLVVAYAIAGTTAINLHAEPLGKDKNGNDVYLKDLWPTSKEIQEVVYQCLKPEMFQEKYQRILEGDENWQNLPVPQGDTFVWDSQSTYIQNPPFFNNLKPEPENPGNIDNARALLLLGDSITTDHISPAGAIEPKYPAGQYLIEKGIKPEDFNSYGSRRGNHEVMMRGTFGNVRIKNHLVSPKEGSLTKKWPEGLEMFIYEASQAYIKEKTDLVVLAGKEYGTGSSRDWAAKGTILLGIKGVIAQSFERIHRSNLVGMGVLPMVFEDGQDWKSLGLDGTESYSISGIANIKPGQHLQVKASKKDGTTIEFTAISRLMTPTEIEYFTHGGILPLVVRKLAK